ncbi:MAG: 30S ribosomal protein S1, partial [Candidatus Latescibacteria bacterium]|nr:30S ribosomal protein S1 [Candidatus Latescibacterota bacterium]
MAEDIKIIDTTSHLSPEDALRVLDESEYSDDQFSEMMDLYEGTLETIEQGEIVAGKVLAIHDGAVVVDIGFKSEGTIPIAEFGDPPAIEVGDEVEVFLESVEDQEGQVVLSKTKADFMRVWDRIKEAYDNDQIVEGRLVRRIKGGIVVDLFGVDAFLPGSQIDIKQVKNFDQFIGDVFPFRIIKLNKNRRNIVVSRRVVLEQERERLRKEILQTLEVGQVRQGMVKNITDFGAFIDLGGLDGLLHITDIAWGRVGHPSEVLSIGDEVEVKVLNYDEERERISLGMKQLQSHPWEDIETKYPVDSKVIGKVVSITDYGAFVELEQGVEGLVHISEMSWTQHIRHPSKLVSIGDECEVMILNIDKDEQKISLGLKQVQPDPWSDLDAKYPSGTRLMGTVRNLTNFGAFVEIEDGIDGLVHISDMSWTKRIRHPNEVVKKGQELEVVVLNIDKDRRRISLGHKQTIENPWAELAVTYAVGNPANGKVSRLLERGVVVDLDGDVEGF